MTYLGVDGNGAILTKDRLQSESASIHMRHSLIHMFESNLNLTPVRWRVR